MIWVLLFFASRNLYDSLYTGPNENRYAQALVFEDINDVGNVLSSYIDDHAPFRGVLISLCQKIETGSEKAYMTAVSFLSGSGNEGQTTVDISALESLGGISSSGAESPALQTEPQVFSEDEYELAESILPTCEEDGYERYICLETGDSYDKILPATGHSGMLVCISQSSYNTWGYEEYECSTCGKLYRLNIVPKLVNTDYLAPRTTGVATIVGRYNWLFYTGNDSLSYYKGTNLLNDEELASYALKLQKLKDLCDEHGIELCLMIIPNKEQVYSEYMPSYEVQTEYKRGEALTDYLRENTDAKVIYPLRELKAGDFYHQTYYKYDTHWNMWGSFIGTRLLNREIGSDRETGLDSIDLLNIPVTEMVSDKTDLILLGGLDLSAYHADIDYVVDYKPDIQFEAVSVSPTGRYISTANNNTHLVLIGDSFQTMMIPYMVKDYAYTTFIQRGRESECSEDILNADILVIEAVERYDSVAFFSMDGLIDMLEEDNG